MDEISPAELSIVLGSAIFLFVVVTNFLNFFFFYFQLIMKLPAYRRPLPLKQKKMSLPIIFVGAENPSKQPALFSLIQQSK